jgi:exosortase B
MMNQLFKDRSNILVAIAVLIGLLALYSKGVHRLITEQWSLADEGHGPILAAMALWAFWRERERLARYAPPANAWLPFCLLFLALALYFVGRVLGIPVVELGSLPLVLASVVWLLGGRPAFNAAIFPLLFLCFALPLPNHVIDAATNSLKQVVSSVAEVLLYKAGYPVARNGVMLNVGQYQLLVADACSGLRSIISLIGVGLFYLYLTGPVGKLRTALLLLALVPIAFVANVMRVMVLILVTYHLGDSAGQGFVHEFAGMFLFVAAVIMVACLDWFLGLWMKNR